MLNHFCSLHNRGHKAVKQFETFNFGQKKVDKFMNYSSSECGHDFQTRLITTIEQVISDQVQGVEKTN